jgi:hypothetical protein
VRSILNLLKYWLYGSEEERPFIPPEIRELSHEIRNERTKLRANLVKLSRHPEPEKELARIMRGENGRESTHH